MFLASLLICSQTFVALPEDSTCIIVTDTTGPKETIELCFKRAEEMKNTLLNNSELNFYMLNLLGFPRAIVMEEECNPIGIDV